MPMLGQRVAQAAATLVAAFLICFFLLHAMPGDPLDRLDSPLVPAQQAERNRQALGLDRPLAEQLTRTIGSYARGDLGVSIIHRRSVARVLAEALPYTALLGCAALGLAYGTGIPLALLLMTLSGAWRRRLDPLLLSGAIVPRFWFAVLLLLLLHGVAGWLPASHAFPAGGGGAIDLLRHLILPALSLGVPASLVVCRYEMSQMEDALEQPHVRTAMARGQGGLALLGGHVLRPAIGPAVALFGLDLPALVSGAIVVEVVFSWPGLGRITAESVLESDYPLALAATLLNALVVIVGRFVASWLSRVADPRQREALS
ncbi:MAG: ABC transporter permease [bacterium]|nr:ABC transporter permease [bacterium]